MFQNLKVRTCVLALLFLLSGAMLVSNGASWLSLNTSNRNLAEVNDAYSLQATELNNAYLLFLRARLLLANTFMDQQLQRQAEAADELKSAIAMQSEASERLDAFIRAPHLEGASAHVAELEKAAVSFPTAARSTPRSARSPPRTSTPSAPRPRNRAASRSRSTRPPWTSWPSSTRPPTAWSRTPRSTTGAPA